MKLLPPSSMHRDAHLWLSCASILIIIIAVTSIWFGSLNNGFLWDDHVIIEENSPSFQALPLHAWFIQDFWNTPTTSTFSGYYRPIVSLSFVFDFMRGGLSPATYHFTNILLHALVSISLWGLLRLFKLDPVTSLYAALIIGIHPIQTQGVAWIAGRADTLASFGIISCLFFFTLMLRGARHWATLSGSLALFGYALALFSKESAITTLPLLFGLLIHERKATQQPLKKEVPIIFFLTGIIFSFVWILMRSSVIPELYSVTHFSIGTVFIIILDLLGGILYPFNFRIDYSTNYRLASLLPHTIVGIAVFAPLLISITLYRKKIGSTLWFSAYASLVSLFPAVIATAMLSVAGTRMMYLPSLFIIPFGVVLLKQNSAPKMFHTICVIFIAVCALSSLRQISLWHSDISLFTHALVKQGSHDVAHLNLGIAKYESGDFEGAAYHLSQKMQRKGEDQRHYMLGLMSLALECEEKAESELRLAIEHNPGLYAAYHNLAGLLANQGRTTEAFVLLKNFKTKSPANLRQITQTLALLKNRQEYRSRQPKRAQWCDNPVALKRLLTSSPILLERAAYFLRGGQLQFARIFARAALRVTPGLVSARLIEAQANYRLGYRTIALEALNQIESVEFQHKDKIERLRKSLLTS